MTLNNTGLILRGLAQALRGIADTIEFAAQNLTEQDVLLRRERISHHADREPGPVPGTFVPPPEGWAARD